MSKISLIGKKEIRKISTPSDFDELWKKILEMSEFANNKQDELILSYIKESKNLNIESEQGYIKFKKFGLNQININIKEKSSSLQAEEKLNTPTEKKNEEKKFISQNETGKYFKIFLIPIVILILASLISKYTEIKPKVDKNNYEIHNQKLVKLLKNVNKTVNYILLLNKIYGKYIADKNIIDRIFNLKKTYLNYLNITRFQIPIIGIVSAGKSTLLNYLLELKNFLETGEDITTRFLCIIRHNKNYKYPVISNLTIENRDKYKYNFIKNQKKEEEYEMDNNYIKQHNIFLCSQEVEKVDIEDYFLLIEVDIPFFHGQFEKYADLIEFIDIPGLNENQENKRQNIENETHYNNSYTSQIIPFIQPNYLFSLFIFKTDFDKIDTKRVIKGFQDVDYLNCLNLKLDDQKNEENYRKENIKKIFKQSLFILNQDIKDSTLEKCKTYLNDLFLKENITSNFNLEEGKNIIEINLKLLNLEQNRFNLYNIFKRKK